MERKIAIAQTGVLRKYNGPMSYGTPISLTKTLRALKPGQSFVVDAVIHRRNVTSTARHVGIKVRTEKLDGKGLLVTLL